MTYLVTLDNVVQGLFGPPITTDHQSAGLLFPPDAYPFASMDEASQRASELPRAVVQERAV